MRLWHKDLIPVLPRKQLCSQWRECCAIAKAIKEKGTPNHILVNKILDSDELNFVSYCRLVYNEMTHRGYIVDWNKLERYLTCKYSEDKYKKKELIYVMWHDDRYLRQCYYNLQEKYDCCGISVEEWGKIEHIYNSIIKNLRVNHG